MYMEKKKETLRKAVVFVGDEIYETVYDPIKEMTRFATLNEAGGVVMIDSVTKQKDLYHPLDPKNELVAKKVILLPSEPFEYGTDELLIKDIQAFIHRYVDISPTFESIATYYALFTWIFDRFSEVPYLRAIGDFGSGKTRFLRVIGSLCYRPIFTGGATTTSPIFRILDQIGGTLVLDEADFRASDMKTDIVKILNEGYSKGSPVLRAEGKGEFEVKAYEVYSPKIIATRETFNDKALESRFLVEEMGRMKIRKDIPLRLNQDFEDDALILRNKLLMWRLRNYHKNLLMEDEHMEGVHPRLHQIIMPILALIDSDEVKEAVRSFVRDYHDSLVEDRGWSWESDIIQAILQLKKQRGTAALLVKDITAAVNANTDESFDRLTEKKVGWYLRSRLHLKTHRTRVGYELDLRKYAEKIEYARMRYGVQIDEEDSAHDDELVSVVNVAQGLGADDEDRSIPF